jgi:WD40 repeat protein
LKGQNEGRYKILVDRPGSTFYMARFALHPSGEHVAVGSFGTHIVYLIPLDDRPVREYPYPRVESGGNRNLRIAFSPNGRLMAVVPTWGRDGVLSLQLWDLKTGEDRIIGSVKGETASIRFIDQRRILWTGNDNRFEGGGQYLFDLETDTVEILTEGGDVSAQVVSSDGLSLIEAELTGLISSMTGRLVWRHLETDEERVITSHGEAPWSVALDPAGQWVATGGMRDGLVRVGPVSGEEPHLLHGHGGGWVLGVAISPDGKWLASCGEDGTVRIWPMPDMTEPPLHTLPHDDLVAKLKTLTNLRVVRDAESSKGWKVEVGPFPGWAEVPEW